MSRRRQLRSRQLSLLPGKIRRRRARTWLPHKPREVNARWPMHVTLRMREHVWQLRSRRCFRIIEGALHAALAKAGARIAQFSVQHNHIHLVVETENRVRLARMIQGLAIRTARRLNRLMGRSGKVFADRYHSRALKTPSEVRAALVYVLANARKHLTSLGHKLSAGWTDDEFSSAPWFDGWSDGRPPRAGPAPVAPARTWLLAAGWRLRAGGPLRRSESPATAAAGTAG
jgi:REP element-mobilizing transposase RayT